VIFCHFHVGVFPTQTTISQEVSSPPFLQFDAFFFLWMYEELQLVRAIVDKSDGPYKLEGALLLRPRGKGYPSDGNLI